MQQKLTTLQGHKQESDFKYQQAQEANRTIQEHLESYNIERNDLRKQLQEVQVSLTNADRDAQQQKSDAEEALWRLEEQLSAELDEARHQNQKLNTQLAETEASHEFKCREYEDQLRKYRHPLGSHKPSHRSTIFQQPTSVQEAKQSRRDHSRSSSRATVTPAVETPTPAANYGTPRKPRKRIDRETISDVEFQAATQLADGNVPYKGPVAQQLSQSRGSLASGSYQRSSQATLHASAYLILEDDVWAPQELGRHETSTEDGVTLRSSPSQAPTEIPETLQDSLSQPKLFSNLDREHEARSAHEPSSSSSSLGLDELTERLPGTTTAPQDLDGVRRYPSDSSSTQKLTEESKERQTQVSSENPFFAAPRPLSRANMSKRMNSASQQRQESHIIELTESFATSDSSLPRTPLRSHAAKERAETQRSSPAFMSQAIARTVYGRRASQPPRTASSAGSKRGASDSLEQSSTKRAKAVSSEAATSEMPSVRMTRAAVAIARRRSDSQASETQSQSQYAASTTGPSIGDSQSQRASIKKSESQSQQKTAKASQSQSQNLSNIPAVSRMRSSQGSSSASSPRNPKGRRTSKITNRFDQELHETKESKTIARR